MKKLLLVLGLSLGVYTSALSQVDQTKVDVFVFGHDIHDTETIISSIKSESKSIIMLDGEDDLNSLTDELRLLAQSSKIQSISLFTHGSVGTFSLGYEVVQLSDFQNHIPGLYGLNTLMNEDGVLNIYSCDAGAGDLGLKFYEKLKEICHFSVNMSDDKTGADGDWELELIEGTFTNFLEVSKLSRNYSHSLQTVPAPYCVELHATTPMTYISEITVDSLNSLIYAAGTASNQLCEIDMAGTVTNIAATAPFYSTNFHPYISTDIQYLDGSIYFNVNNNINKTTDLGMPITHSTSHTLTPTGSAYEAGMCERNGILYTSDGGGPGNCVWQHDPVAGTSSLVITGLPANSYHGMDYCKLTDKMYLCINGFGIYELDIAGGGFTLVVPQAAMVGTQNGNMAVDPFGQYAYVHHGATIGKYNLATGTGAAFVTAIPGGNTSQDLKFGPASAIPNSYSLYFGGGPRLYEITGPTYIYPTVAEVTDECSVTLTAPTTTNCLGTTTATTTDPTTYTGDGTYTVTWSFTDGIGQTVDVTQTVIIDDVTAPVISGCPSDITMDADNAGCTGIATWVMPTATDNCGGSPTSTSTHTSGDAFPLGTTTVTITFDDGSGNTADCSFDVTVNNSLSATATATDANCADSTDGSVALDVSGGTAVYTFDWTDGGAFSSADEDLVDVGAATYDVTVTDANGCEAFASAAVNEPTPVTVTVDGSSDPSGCGLADGSINITASGGTVVGPYTYDWTDGALFTSSDEDLIDLTQGTYTVTVTDDNSCPGEAVITLNDPEGPTIDYDAVLSDTTLQCFGDTTGVIELDVTLNGGATSATYDWDIDGTGDMDDTEDLSDLGEGTYILEVEDNNGCVASIVINIIGPTEIITTATVTDVTCHDDVDGAIDIEVTGGGVVTDYVYDWDIDGLGDADDTPDLADLASGTYILVVTDDSMCTDTTTIEVLNPDPVDATAIITDEMTGGDGEIDLTPTGGSAPYTFDWTGPDSFTSTDEDLTGLTAGTYTVTITDDNGCDTTIEFTVSSQVGFGENSSVALNIYPNPTNGLFNMNISNGQLLTAEIYNSLGQLVYSQQINSTDAKVDLGAYERGVYQLRLNTSEGLVHRQIVLQ